VSSTERIADSSQGVTLSLLVFMGVDLQCDGQTGVAEDELGIARRDTEVLQQSGSRVPQVMHLDHSQAVGLADAMK